MSTEQENIISILKKSHNKTERIVIYGTGINAEAVVKHCYGFSIVGLMDATKTGQELWGLQVLSEEQIVELDVKKIVIVARPAVHSIIYKRIEKFVTEHGIVVCDVYGNDVSTRVTLLEVDNEYFGVSYDDLLDEIKSHDVITFDIFDTLLCRRTFQPQDVFALMESNDIVEGFPFMRETIQEEIAPEVTIYEIYNAIREKSHLSNKQVDELMLREIAKEKQVLYLRQRIVECFKQCCEMGKEVYLVSDMYLPKAVLEEILQEKGISGYKDLLISCEYGVSKANGLFEILKAQIGDKSCLHIGDNHHRDYICAKDAGIDAFEIVSPIKMMEMSTYKDLLSYTKTLEQRMTLGMLTSVLFNDPFALYQSKGRPFVNNVYLWGYSYIAPLVLMFMSWMVNCLNEEKDAVVLFAARDGFLFQKIYNVFKEKLVMNDLPKDIYLLISRRAIARETRDEISYKNHLEELDLIKKQKVYFIDFMSKGTCQLGLQEVLGYEIEGLYVQRSLCARDELNQLSVRAFYSESSAMDNNKRIFAMCDFLECIFTSFMPSLIGFGDDKKPIFEDEIRTQEQMDMVNEIHRACTDFVEEYLDLFEKIPNGFENPDLCDAILAMTQNRYTRINLPELERMALDDAYGIEKNTGKDILQ